LQRPLPLALKEALLALNTPGDNELHRAALAANALVRIYAEQVHVLLQQCGVPPSSVRAIGAHGQTVRHRPQEFDGTGYTLQLNNPACWQSCVTLTLWPIFAVAMWPLAARCAPRPALPSGFFWSF
jgi:anhydro-N-acetylmuramic acid kinase